MSEAALHRAVAGYLTSVVDAREVWWSTFPSGGGGRVRGAILKDMGLQAGVPDLVLIPRNRPAHWIELKAPGKYPEPHQRELHAILRGLGCPVAVCRSVDEVEGVLRAWCIPMRGRIAA